MGVLLLCVGLGLILFSVSTVFTGRLLCNSQRAGIAAREVRAVEPASRQLPLTLALYLKGVAVDDSRQAFGTASVMKSDQPVGLRRLPVRILSPRRFAQIARAHMLASIPSINPAGKAAIVGCYCYRTFPTAEFHAGIDLDANYGDAVRASAAGTVVSAGYDGGYGLKVDIDHGNGYHTWYAHLSRVDVHPGEKVAKAQAIALVGSTGRSTGPHLHYQVMLNGRAIDPEPFLRGIPPQVLAALP